MSAIIRPATAADATSIRSIVRAAGINPVGLDWRRFLVADDGGRVVGVGQVKPHGDGSRELASIAVVPERQGEGIGRRIVGELLARESGPVYLMCQRRLAPFYRRFGFAALTPREMPPSLRWPSRVANGLIWLLRRAERISVMRRG